VKKTLTTVLLGVAAAAAVLAQQPQTKPAEPPAPAQGDALMQIDQFIRSSSIDKSDPAWRTKLPKPPKATFAPGTTYYAVMDTNKGSIKIRLLSDVAPMHVTSFLYLSRLGFYDGLTLHRVIPGFMAQGGCPIGDGRGEPGYRYDGEYDPKVVHDRRGKLSAANTGRPNTDGSQFFLTFAETPWLDGKHTIYGEVVDFGEVEEGRDTLGRLEAAGSQSGATRETLRIEKVTIVTS
jgi:peptidylprolyl isomerase